MAESSRLPKSAVAVIVCYNNGENAAATLAMVPAAGERDFDVVVIDDGSTDDTMARIEPFGFPVVRHERNQGLGAAIKSGMRYAVDHGYDLTCILAGNAKDNPRQIPLVLAPLRAGNADYVQGSRFAEGGSDVNTPAFRFVMVKVHATLLWLLTGFRGTDALNGFRAYRTALLTEDGINVFQDWLNGYEMETYLHFSVLSKGKRAVEVGVSKTYPPRATEARRKYSHIRPFVDWWRILKPIPLLMLKLRK